ncbi:MAG: rhodanese-like domain-containing protein [Betaproteobacteria bacterium]|nr:rhodanese-like domain-containing protein [Betaproteobacteria bacterium]
MKVDLAKFIADNVFLIGVAVVSGAMLLWPLVRRGTAGPSVSPLEATQLINRQDALVLDIRSAEEFQKGHILNARNVPAAQLEPRLADLEKFRQKPVIVACESGSRSGSAAALLRKHGFAQAASLAGGVGAWQQAGLPMEK